MSSFFSFGTVFFVLNLLALCHAQSSKIFQWQFTSSVSTGLPSCQEMAINVKPFDVKNATGSSGVPPYYMLSFAVGGTPKTDFMGTDPALLKWTVNHPVGTSLMLNVVDSTGSAGGIPPKLFTVVTGQSTTCVETTPKSDFTVSANVTETLTTCQPWGLRIKGGVPPYNITLAAVNSPVVTNVTLGPVDDAFTYINRADPDRQLVAAVCDFTGRWAYGTPIVSTKGSTDVACIGFGSSGGNSTTLEKEARDAAAALAASASKKRSSIIAGVVVSVLVLLALAAGSWYFFVYRRRKVPNDTEKGQDMSVNPFSPAPSVDSTPGQVLSINSFISSGPRTPKSPQDSSFTTITSFPSQNASSIPYASESDSRPTSGHSSSRGPSFAAFPRASTRGSQKAIEAGVASPPSPASQTLGDTDQEAEGSGAEYVYQHRDGGVVRELPPPYMNPSTPRP